MAHLVGDPAWGEGNGPRVLVEAADWGTRQAYEQVLGAAGYRTVSCPGPSGADDRCHLAAGTGCDAAAQADVVVHTLHPSDQRNAEALLTLRRRLRDTPLIVEVPEPIVRSRPGYYDECTVVHAPMTSAALLDAVAQAVLRDG